jgi:hypothetical protein
MAKFVKVKEAPSNLDKDCYVIEAPNFKKQIEKVGSKQSKSGLITPNYLREVFAAIGSEYAPETFNPLTSINVSHYRGVPLSNVESTIRSIIETQCPHFIDLFVDKKIKSRPNGTKLIYFLGDFKQTSMFSQNGIDEIKEKEIDVYLGKKKKKVVGKPAITNEEAAAINKK